MAVPTDDFKFFSLYENEINKILFEIGEDIENPTLKDSDWCKILTDRLFLFPGIKRGDVIVLPRECFDYEDEGEEDEDEVEEDEDEVEEDEYKTYIFIFDGERVVNRFGL